MSRARQRTRSWRSHLVFIGLWLALGACSREEVAVTQLVATVSADQALATRLTRIELATFDSEAASGSEAAAATDTHTFALGSGEGQHQLPFSLGIQKQRVERFLVVVTGYEADQALVMHKTFVRFVDGQRRSFNVHLAETCLGELCGGTDSAEALALTCSAAEGEPARCAPVEETPSSPVSYGNELDDVTTGALDGGPNARPDASDADGDGASDEDEGGQAGGGADTAGGAGMSGTNPTGMAGGTGTSGITNPTVAPGGGGPTGMAGGTDAGNPGAQPDAGVPIDGGPKDAAEQPDREPPPPSCNASDRDCLGLVPRSCQTGVLQASGPACPFGCDAGVCVGECRAGDRACQGSELRVCGANLSWTRTSCPAVCDVQGGCVGSCRPGQRQCNPPRALLQCSSAGAYQPLETCANACLVVAGAATCVGCTSGDGLCPSGCVSPADSDCPREIGEACSATSQCRSGFCVDGVCCNQACGAACQACNLPGSVGTCATQSFASDSANCGACGTVCSANHIAASCSAGSCGGMCESGYGNCNSNLQSDGCETDLRSNAQHCGACGTVCPYGVCSGRACVADRWGFSVAGPTSERRGARTLMGSQLTIGTAGRLVALGIAMVVAASDPNVNMRLALYRDFGGGPQSLVAQSAAFTIRNGVNEISVPSTQITAGTYWFFYLTDGDARFSTETTSVTWWFRNPVEFGALPMQVPSLQSAIGARADVFAVTVP